jgi:hypothetical protein
MTLKSPKKNVVENALLRKEEDIEGLLCVIYVPLSNQVE